MEEKAFLVDTHQNSDKVGEPGQILGVVYITLPASYIPRVCYKVHYEDGTVVNRPLAHSKTFKIISESDVTAGRIPAITN